MRILTLHNSYRQFGGEDTAFQAELDLLRQHGHEVLPLTASNADLSAGLRAAAETVWSQRSYRRVRQTIREFAPDIVHAHNLFPRLSPSVYHACRAESVPVVQTLQNYRLLCLNAKFFRDGRVCTSCLNKSVAYPGVIHKCYRDSAPASAVVAAMQSSHRLLGTWRRDVTRYIALTEFARKLFIEGGLPADKIRVKPNCLSPDPGLGDGDGGFALFVGRLVESKGVKTLVEAWAGMPYALKIAGSGPLESLAGGSASNVEWLGHVNHAGVLDLMRKARFLVFPSEWFEGFPLVLAEAFAIGLPVVAASVGAAAEIVADGETGLQFPPGDSGALRACSERMIHDDLLWGGLRRRAREEYCARYAPAINLRMLTTIYDEAIADIRSQA